VQASAGTAVGSVGRQRYNGQVTADPIVAQAERIGCDTTLRFAGWFRDRRAPRAVALERRLGDVGGFCDCGILWNGWCSHPRLWTPAREVEDDGILLQDEPQPPHPLPACATVRLGSTRPCSNWIRRTQFIMRW